MDLKILINMVFLTIIFAKTVYYIVHKNCKATSLEPLENSPLYPLFLENAKDFVLVVNTEICPYSSNQIDILKSNNIDIKGIVFSIMLFYVL